MSDQQQPPSQFVFPTAIQPPEEDVEQPHVHREPWGWLEVFVLIQVLWGIALFVPGAQAYRAYVRGLPYVASLVALVVCARSGGADIGGPGARWILFALFLLGINLLHTSVWMMSGIAQIVFQLAIAAPVFWAIRMWITPERLDRIMWLVLAAHCLSAGLGLLQVYYPDQFLPPQFSSLGLELNPELIGSLSYTGTDDRLIIRPPGLTDLPGGAAVSGVIAGLLAFGYATRAATMTTGRLAYLGVVLVGVTVIYLTQIRSLLLMFVICLMAAVFVSLRQGRAIYSGWKAALAGGLVLGSFVWAVTLGGEAVAERFRGVMESGIVESYKENRGMFLEYTFRELVFEYPFGGGLGRWGMMSLYFGEPENWRFPALYAEIQPTGWLYDGGILMWLLYGGAIVVALRRSYQIAIDREHPLHDLASMVLTIQVLIAGLCFTGAAFNTQLGILFWLVTAVLYGAHRTVLTDEYLEAVETEAAEAAEAAEAERADAGASEAEPVAYR